MEHTDDVMMLLEWLNIKKIIYIIYGILSYNQKSFKQWLILISVIMDWRNCMKIKNSVFDIILNIASIILLLGIIIYLIIRWSSIPDQVPGHFNASGEVTRWDSKGSLIIIPIIAWVLYIGMTILEQFPQVWNTGVRVTQENMFRVYRILKSMISIIKLLIVATFASIVIIQSLAVSLPAWLLPVFISLIFGTVVINIVRLIRAR